MKKFLLFLFLAALGVQHSEAQKLVIQKGKITDGVIFNDSLNENFALYLPTKYEAFKTWPVMLVFNMEGKGKQTLQMLKNVADKKGYIMASPNQVHDSLSLAANILIASRTLKTVEELFNINTKRVYTIGYENGGEFAAVVPSFIRGIEGVISLGASVGNTELLSLKKPFHFISVVGNADYAYPEARNTRKLLNRLKFPNQLILYDGKHKWPEQKQVLRALNYFELAAMAKGNITIDSAMVKENREQQLAEVDQLISINRFLLAEHLLAQTIDVHRVYGNIELLKEKRVLLKKEKTYKTQKRSINAYLFKESLIKEDYNYYIYEDITTYNYNNLGWWNYQMEEIAKFKKSANHEEKLMGQRLFGFVNKLVEDNILTLKEDTPVDEEGVLILWMLKTITDAKDFSYYLKVISTTSKHQDYGTAIFYVEELLKNGYTNMEELYSLEHTALLRITPEFNAVVAKYLKDARYVPIDE